jgi:hypothetical protein
MRIDDVVLHERTLSPSVDSEVLWALESILGDVFTCDFAMRLINQHVVFACKEFRFVCASGGLVWRELYRVF